MQRGGRETREAYFVVGWTAADPEQQELTTPQDRLTPGLRFELSRDPLNQCHRSLLRATVRNPPPPVNALTGLREPPSGTGRHRSGSALNAAGQVGRADCARGSSGRRV